MDNFPAYRPVLRRLFGKVCRFVTRVTSDTTGVAAIEFAMVVPLMILMVVAAADIGMGYYTKMQVEDSTQVGAEWAMKNGFDAVAISNAVTSATNASGINVSPSPVQFCGCANGSSISTATCGSTCPGGALSGTYLTVSAQKTYSTIINYGFFPSSYNFTSQSTVRLQ